MEKTTLRMKGKGTKEMWLIAATPFFCYIKGENKREAKAVINFNLQTRHDIDVPHIFLS